MGRVVHGASCPWGELSMGRVVRGAKCLWGELSVGQDVRGAKCLWGEMSVGRNVRGARCRGASCHGAGFHVASCPRASCLGASVPGTNFTFEVLVPKYVFSMHISNISSNKYVLYITPMSSIYPVHRAMNAIYPAMNISDALILCPVYVQYL
jgi:hypothetical protein